MLEISEDNFVFKYSRSSGPGGQNVNKLNTRVTLFFDVAQYEGFSDSQKKSILKKLATRADKDGVIRVVSQKYRTQKANRKAAIKKLLELLTEALRKRTIRRITQVPHWAKEKRLREKKQRGWLKQQRSQKDFDF